MPFLVVADISETCVFVDITKTTQDRDRAIGVALTAPKAITTVLQMQRHLHTRRTKAAHHFSPEGVDLLVVEE